MQFFFLFKIRMYSNKYAHKYSWAVEKILLDQQSDIIAVFGLGVNSYLRLRSYELDKEPLSLKKGMYCTQAAVEVYITSNSAAPASN